MVASSLSGHVRRPSRLADFLCCCAFAAVPHPERYEQERYEKIPNPNKSTGLSSIWWRASSDKLVCGTFFCQRSGCERVRPHVTCRQWNILGMQCPTRLVVVCSATLKALKSFNHLEDPIIAGNCGFVAKWLREREVGMEATEPFGFVSAAHLLPGASREGCLWVPVFCQLGKRHSASDRACSSVECSALVALLARTMIKQVNKQSSRCLACLKWPEVAERGRT